MFAPRTDPLLAPIAPAAPARMPAALVVLVLSLLLGIQPVTTDLYLPALPALSASLVAPVAHARLTLSALLLAFGCSQLVWGPLSDRFGRRPVLLWGLGAYTVASMASTFAPSMAGLITARIVQGAAMGAAVVCARAVVRDLYAPIEAAKVMSRGLSGLGLLACLSAPIGGLLSDAFGWRAALLAVAVFGAGTLALVALRFTETLATKNPLALQPRSLLAAWRRIVGNPTFVAYCALTAASYGGLFTFLASSSFVFIGLLGLSKTQYGLLMLSMSLFYIFGTFLCRRLLPRFGLRKTVALAAALSLTGGTGMGLLAVLGVGSTASVMLPFYVFMVGHGVHQPCGQSGAVNPFATTAGTAAALNGFLTMVVAFAISGWLALQPEGSVRPLTDGVWFWSVCIALAAWTLVQKYGEPAAA